MHAEQGLEQAREQAEQLLQSQHEENARLNAERRGAGQGDQGQGARRGARHHQRRARRRQRSAREGTEISRNLRELSASLRNNAERLLRDVRLAHGGMTARLDQVAHPASGPPPTRARRRAANGNGADAGEDLDVPEFIPRG